MSGKESDTWHGHRSTTSGGAKFLDYWDYDPDDPLDCPSCGWSGARGGIAEEHRDLLDFCCPRCDKMLLIVPFPTLAETRAAAEAGNPRARSCLPGFEAAEARARQARSMELREPDQLPDLVGEQLVIDWDFEDRDAEKWTVLRHGNREIWRELAYWEGYPRFAEVFEILRTRYGDRLAEVRPTQASKLYLYGDAWSAPSRITELNTSLRDPGGPNAE